MEEGIGSYWGGGSRDSLGVDLALGTQADTRVGDIAVVTISGWHIHFMKRSSFGSVLQGHQEGKESLFLGAKNKAKDEYIFGKTKMLSL